MRILVLGANGFVGRTVMAHVARHHGVDAAVAGVRSPPAPDTFGKGCEVRLLDATDRAAVEASLDGITHIINSVMGTNAAIVGSAHATVASLAYNPGIRLVHLSSVAVYGMQTGIISDDSPSGHPADGYAAAKIEAERIVQDAVGARSVLLRPGLVYGPGSALWTLRIARLLKSGRLGDLGREGAGLCNLVHVADVAAAAVAACETEDVGGRALNLAAPSPPDWNRYLTDFAAELGLPVRRISSARLAVEKMLAYPIKLAEKAGFKGAEPITPGLARLFTQNVVYDSAGASASLLPGWRPYAEGLSESAVWAARALE